MKYLSTLLLFVAFIFASQNAHAQDDPPGFLGFQQGIAPGAVVGDINQAVDSLWKPVLDGMVDEGLITNWGILTHGWGDEWNWNWYMATKDQYAFFAAWDTVAARIGNDLGLLYDKLDSHKDNLYIMSQVYNRELSDGEQPPGFLMFNQHHVAQSDLPKVNELTENVTAPVLNALVDEGLLNGWGVLQHSWADEWNWNFYMITKDHASFLTAWGEMAARVSEADPEAFAEFDRLSKRHKDNLYNIRYAK